MPLFEEHCKRCKEILGEEFSEVHKWLDNFYGKPPYGSKHRCLRHHKDGIEEVRKLWGDRAAQAAKIHIRQDLNEEGWPDNKPIPRNGEEYIKAGLW
jgi:hypothetical protein